jgi:hypothetical protein
MMSLPFALKSPAVLGRVFWKIFLTCIAGALLVSTMARAELPVVVPETTAAVLTRMRDGNIRLAAFELQPWEQGCRWFTATCANLRD